jgi:hypothetical protein
LEECGTSGIRVKEALKAQLRFGKNVCQQKPENNAVYNFSKVANGQRVNLTVDEMKIMI